MIEGNPTAQATVTQQIEQWKPQLNRTVTFPRDQKSPLTLPTPGPGVKLSSPEFKQQLAAKIREALPNAEGWLSFSPQGIVLGPDSLNNIINSHDGVRIQQLMSICQAPGVQPNQGGSGLFTLFNQISPSADTSLADMVIATPGHEVLCVAVREANNALVIYRWRFSAP